MAKKTQTHHQALYQFAAEHVGLFKNAVIGDRIYPAVECRAGGKGKLAYYRLVAIDGPSYHEFLFARDGRLVSEQIIDRPAT